MRLLAISGSSHDDQPITQALEALLDGFRGAGGEAEVVYLPDLSIERCRQCDMHGTGRCSKEGVCIIEDDFSALVEAAARADVLALATPVDFGDVSPGMRTFIDRLRRYSRPRLDLSPFKGKPAVGLCVSHAGREVLLECCAALELPLQHSYFEVVDMVAICAADLDLKLDVLRRTGAWLAATAPQADPPSYL